MNQQVGPIMPRIHPTYSGPLVFGGTAGRHLSSQVCRYLKVQEGDLEVSRFSDGEIGVKINENVRGADCYLIQPTSPPTNETLMEMLLTVDAMRRASAERINVIVPYFGYGRQDRKEQGRVALSAKLVANLISTAGVDRVICLDLHSAQIQGFFDIVLDHLYAQPVIISYLRRQAWTKNMVVISPDVGNVKMSRAYARRLDAPLDHERLASMYTPSSVSAMRLSKVHVPGIKDRLQILVMGKWENPWARLHPLELSSSISCASSLLVMYPDKIPFLTMSHRF